ncbi:hypothetical protein [Companilactobacillus jidongensis]|uniref:hypothetical protein n=1 Tax=Companilactobacillus jidongensis TaxID=2486006 RepID=UPI000F76C3E3|nr:hypothetical protein [Companilactobacillus jidongensis]
MKKFELIGTYQATSNWPKRRNHIFQVSRAVRDSMAISRRSIYLVGSNSVQLLDKTTENKNDMYEYKSSEEFHMMLELGMLIELKSY